MLTLKKIYAENFLLEKSFSTEDIPEFFYISIEYRSFDQLANHQLVGIKGITSKSYVANSFKYNSPITLKMPGRDVLRLNKISMVNYDNPDYLVSKNLNAFKRVLDESAYRLIFNIFSALFREIEYASRRESWASDWVRKTAMFVSSKLFDTLPQMKIQSINDFVLVLKAHLPQEAKEISFKRIKEVTKKHVLLDVDIHSIESEWIIKTNIFIIPPKTSLTFHTKYIKGDPEEVIGKYDLRKNYTIHFTI